MAQKFEIIFDASMNVGQIRGSVNEIQKSLSSISLPQNLTTKFSTIIGNLSKELDNFERLAQRGFETKGDFSQFEKSGKKVLDLFDDLKYSVSSLTKMSDKDLEKLFPKELSSNIKEAKSALTEYTRAAAEQEKEIKKQQQTIETFEKRLAKLKDTQKKTEQKTIVYDTEYKELQNQVKEAENALVSLQKKQEKLNAQSQQLESSLKAPKKSSIYRQIQEQLEELNPQVEEAKNTFNNLHTQLSNTTTLDKQKTKLDDLASKISVLEEELANARAELSNTQSNKEAIDKLFTALEKITAIDLSTFPRTLEGAASAIDALVSGGIDEVKLKIKDVGNAANNANGPVKEFGENIRKTGDDFDKFDAAARDVEALKQRITYFFGLNNSINLARRAIQNAFETIKELDKTMTQTAVVTDFTVSDMWEQLPEYTKRANELGVATNDAYAAATLYYQQGLKTNEVIAVSNETLKMARIAGIEAAEATDYMTAALRGFNMEINEASAKRVNDVYSELAAITASDTQEISVAMTKVASLAHNANMEFETTAAFLSQIIETTRESAETAGTALKTVIARFSEVKELYSEGELLGTDEEGLEIDVNKISTALRTAGINLNEYLTGVKGLDEIFLELAKKWDSLSTVQQRYIATQAAGSRQQSRFIAMMSNYDRTIELVGAANDSAGASQEQFNKTLDSLETKLAKLKNAWNEFTMGLANNEVIKGAVDLLTLLLNTINKITGALPGFTSSLAKIAITWAGLKVGKATFDGIFASLGKAGTEGGKIFRETFVKEFSSIGKGEFFKSTLSKLTSVVAPKIGSAVSQIISPVAGLRVKVFLLNHTMLTSIGTIALVVAAVYALVKAYQLLKENTPEGKLKAAKEATEAASQAAEDVAESYNNLKDSLNELGDKYQNIENLTRGTQEWRDAVKEVNDEVLNLIENFPELAKNNLVSMKNGVLSIDLNSEDVQEILADYEKTSFDATAAEVGAKIYEAQAQLAVDYENLSYKAQIQTSAKEAEGGKAYDEEATRELAIGLAKGTIIPGTESMTDFLNSTGMMVSQTDEAIVALKEFGQSLIQQSLQQDALTKTLAANAINMIDTSDYSEDQISQMQNFLNSLDLSGAYESIAGTSYQNMAAEEQSKYRQFFDDIYGISADVTKTGEVTYYEDGEKKIIPEEQAQAMYAASETTNKAANAAEKFAGILNTINKSGSTFAKHLYDAGEGLALTEKDLSGLKDTLGGTDLSKLVDEQGKYTGNLGDDQKADILSSFGLDDAQVEELYGSVDNFIAYVIESAAMAEDSFADIGNNIKNLLSNIDFTDLELNSGQMSLLSQHLLDISLKSGEAATEGLYNQILSLMSGLTEEEGDIFINALNALDWSSINSIEDFSDTLKDFGLSLPEDAVNSLEQSIISLGQASKTVNFDELKEQISNLSNIRSGIISGEQGRMFSEQDMQTLIDSGIASISDFVYNFDADAYAYLGDSTNQIVAAIEQQTADLLGEDSLGQKVAGGQIGEELLDLYRSGGEDMSLFGNQADFLRAYSVNLEAEGYEGFDQNQLSKLKDMAAEGSQWAIDTLQQMYDGVLELIANLSQNTEDLRQSEQMKPVEVSSDAELYRMAQQADLGTLTTEDATLGDPEKAVNQILAMASAYSECEDEIRDFNNAISAYKKAIESGADGTKEMSDAQKSLGKVLASAQIEQLRNKLKSLSSALSDIVNELENINPETEAYQGALANLSNEVNKYLGYDLSSDFFADAENLNLLKEALDGSQSSWETLINNMIRAQVQSSDFANQFGLDANAISTLVSQLDGLSFDINGYADLSQVFNSLIAAGLKAEEVAKILESLGYVNIKYDVDYQDVKVPVSAVKQAARAKKAGKTWDTGDFAIQYQTIKAPAGIRASGQNAYVPASSGTGFGGYSGGSGGGGGGGGSKEEPWENPYDWLYNLTEKINEQLRIREKLERKYSQILENRSKNAQELYQNMMNQLSALEKEKELQQEMLDKRTEEAERYMSENSDVLKYGRLIFGEEGQLTIEIDWEAVNAVTDTEEGQRIEEYISKLEELQDEIESASDELDDIEDRILEIYELGKDEYFNLENEIFDAIVNERQSEIDKLTAIDESINDTNQKVIASIQSEINKIRQDRENEDTEQEIADKQRRLVYLQQDTSGANALEILQLQEEIRTAQQDYTDNLIDQKISELEEQNDVAAEQRQMQIRILEKQLEHDQETGAIWDAVYSLMNEGLSANGLIRGSKLESILKDSNNWSGMSELSKVEWLGDLETEIKAAVNYLKVGRSTSGLLSTGELKSGQKITFTTSDGKTVTGTVGSNGYVTDSYGKIYKNVYQDVSGNFITDEKYQQVTSTKPSTPTPAATTPTSTAPAASSDTEPKAGSYERIKEGAKFTNGQSIMESVRKSGVVKGKTGGFYLYRFSGDNALLGTGGTGVYDYTGWMDKKYLTAYRTGGLADFTGPAWLDGTPSKPEIILNQKDSQNFIQLRDILASLLNSNNNGNSESNGDNYFDIDINVESLGSSYDTENLAEDIKQMIVKDAMYRNVNVINNMR